jgi:hypothetical protein
LFQSLCFEFETDVPTITPVHTTSTNENAGAALCNDGEITAIANIAQSFSKSNDCLLLRKEIAENTSFGLLWP